MTRRRRPPTGADGRRRRSRGDRPPSRSARPGLLRAFNDAGVLERGRRPRRAAAVRRSAGEHRRAGRAGRWRWRCARCGAGRSASTCSTVADEVVRRVPDRPGRPRGQADADPRRGDPAAGCPGPSPAAWVTPSAGQPADPAGRGGATVLRLLEDRLLYLDRYWREEEQVCADLLARPAAGRADAWTSAALETGPRPGLPRHGVRRAARRRADRPGPAHHRADRRARHRQDHHRRRPCWRCSPSRPRSPAGRRPRVALAAPTGKAAARLQQAVEDEVAGLRPGRPGAASAGAAGGDPAPAARAAARHLDPVPPPPRQPAAARRRRRRRDLDGLADDDGPAARGGAARDPADPRRRPRPADLGRGRRRAGRPGRRPRRGHGPPRSRRCAPPTASARRSGGLAEAVRDGDADRRSTCCGPATSTSVLRRRTADPAPRCASCCCPRRAGAASRRRRGRRGDGRAARARRAAAAVRPPRGPATASATGTARSSGGWPRRPASRSGRPGTPGRPLLVTANDYGLGRLQRRRRRRGPRARPGLRAPWSPRPEPLDLAPSRLGEVETMHAMTIHKSQGSQADEVVVVLPPPELAAADPRAVLHRDHPGPGAGRGGRRRGRRAGGDRAAGRSGRPGCGERLAAPARRAGETPCRGHGAQRGPLGCGACRTCCASSCPTSPGRWGAWRRAIGEAGGDIEAIEIVEKRHDGTRGRRRAARDGARRRCPTPSSRRATPRRRARWCGSASTPPAATSSSTSRRSRSSPPTPPQALDRLVDCCRYLPRRLGRAGAPLHGASCTRTGAAPATSPFVEIERAARFEVARRRRQPLRRRPPRRQRDRGDRPPRRPGVPRLRARPPRPPRRPRRHDRPPDPAGPEVPAGRGLPTCRPCKARHVRNSPVDRGCWGSWGSGQTRSSRNTGISRSVFSWYSSVRRVDCATARSHHTARSSPSATRAR